MAKISVKAVFNHANRLRNDGTGAIAIYVAFGGKKRYINTNFCVPPKNFDEKTETVKNLRNATEINMRIREIKNSILDRKDQLDIKGDVYTIEDVLAQEDKKPSDFIAFIREQSQYKTNTKTGLNVGKAQQSAYNMLIANLQQFVGAQRIPFDKITLDFIKKFDLFLKETPIHGKILHINTIKKRHDILRSFVHIAVEEDLIIKNPYNKFTYRGIEARRDYLTDDELKKVENLFPLQSVELTKDIFLFGCYTGLRFADIIKLTSNDIHRNGNEVYLTIRESKTQKNKINYPLHKLFCGKPIAIIDKYHSDIRQTLFPTISNQEVNRTLKTIAMSVGIKKELSFHVSRHTFGTFMANHGADALTIKDFMNHSSIETSLRYIHESEKTQNAKLDGVNFDY